jgi:27-O-demethylrifamycin SV methyltransferase
VADTTYDPASHYDRVTEAWGLLLGNDLHYGLFAAGTEELADATHALTACMVEASRLAPGMAVLDVGCGTGAPACALALDREVLVTGITTSAVGVEAASARAVRVGVGDKVQFELRDGTDNGLPDASFDRVWVLESSHLMPDRERLMAECARVVRPGGRLALCDIVLRRPLPFLEVRRLRQPFGLLREVFGDAHMQPLERYAGLATDNGMTVDTQIDLTAGTRPTFGRWRDNAERHRGRVVELLGEVDWRHFVDSCTVLEQFWDDGTLGYGLIAAARI